MGRSRHSFQKRLNYWFDNLMVKGLFSKVLVLLIVTLVFIVVVGLLASIATGDFGSKAPAGFFTTFMYVLGIGDPPTEEPTIPESGYAYVALMVLSILYCAVFTAVLIGLINEGITSKVEDLGTGQSDVLEDGHVLILGFNDATYALVEELIEANRCGSDVQTIVVLGLSSVRKWSRHSSGVSAGHRAIRTRSLSAGRVRFTGSPIWNDARFRRAGSSS